MNVEVKRIQTPDLILWILIATTLFFLPSAMDVFNFPKQWLLGCLTLGIVSHYVLGGSASRLSRGPATAWLALLLILTTFFMLLSATLTNTTLARSLFGYPGRANGLITYICIFLIVWIGSRLKLPFDYQDKVLRCFIFIFFIFGTYSTIQFLDLDPVPWNNPYNRIIGTLGNPNFSGAFLGIASAITLNLAKTGSRRHKGIIAIISAWLLSLAILTQSLQAIGIFIIGIVLQALSFAFKKISRVMFISLFIALLLPASLFSAGLLGYGPLGQSIYQYTLRLRLEYWRVGFEIAREFPWTGIGPDSYVEGFRLFRGANFVGRYSQEVIADSAHNALINFMANFGIPAFLFYFSVVFIVSRRSLKILFSSKSSQKGVELLALAWLLMLTQSLFSLEQIGLNVFQWCCGALILNPGINELHEEKRNLKPKVSLLPEKKFLRSLRTEISLLLILIAMISSWNFEKQEKLLLKIVSIAPGSTLSESEFETSVLSFNFFVKDEVRRAFYVADFYNKVRRYGEAQVLLENVVKKDPDAYEALEQLARLANFSSDVKLELMYRNKISEIDPYNYKNLLDIAEIFRELGDLSEAKRYANQVISLSKESLVNETATSILNSR